MSIESGSRSIQWTRDPFTKRTSINNAEEFIVSWAQEFPGKDPIGLRAHVNELPQADALEVIEPAIHY